MENDSQTSSNNLLIHNTLSSDEKKSTKFYQSLNDAETDKGDSSNINEICIEKDKKLLNLNYESENKNNLKFYEIDKLFKFRNEKNENDKKEYIRGLENLDLFIHKKDDDSFSISDDEWIISSNNETVSKYIQYFKKIKIFRNKNLLLNTYFRFILTKKEEKDENSKKNNIYIIPIIKYKFCRITFKYENENIILYIDDLLKLIL